MKINIDVIKYRKTNAGVRLMGFRISQKFKKIKKFERNSKKT